METVPKMISTKDLSYLSDMFHWNFTAFKELKHFANEVENEEIQELFQGLSEMHYQHMEWILSILKNEEVEDEGEEDTEEYEEESEEDSEDDSEEYEEDSEEDDEDSEDDSEEGEDTDESE